MWLRTPREAIIFISKSFARTPGASTHTHTHTHVRIIFCRDYWLVGDGGGDFFLVRLFCSFSYCVSGPDR